MGVSVGDVDTLMPYTLCNSQGSEAHVDQQTDVAMSQIVYANPFHPRLLAATVHFSVEIAFADGEHPAVRLHSIELLLSLIHILKRNEYVSIESVERICRVMECGVDDILEFVPEEKEGKES